ncbi:TerB family tellurite resistance protein [Pendulispora rubella]|uniref:TerB family tellurite resistance protein n=1 Tax=Pendulispora rubella TaxID=2741070 RepID=A0ABZ2LHI8_9BACT
MDVRIAKCLLLTKVLVADGIMTENERELLESTMERHGLSPEEKRSVFDLEGWDAAEAVVAELPEDEKRQLVDQLIDAASVDGRLSPLEAATLKSITGALGLDS